MLDAVDGIRRIPAEQWRGELGFLAAISPTAHRLNGMRAQPLAQSGSNSLAQLTFE